MSRDKIDDIDKLDNIIEDCRNAKGRFLEKYGWKHRCDFPDAVWRWCKVVAGREICLNLEDAVWFEKHDTYLEEPEDE